MHIGNHYWSFIDFGLRIIIHYSDGPRVMSSGFRKVYCKRGQNFSQSEFTQWLRQSVRRFLLNFFYGTSYFLFTYTPQNSVWRNVALSSSYAVLMNTCPSETPKKILMRWCLTWLDGNKTYVTLSSQLRSLWVLDQGIMAMWLGDSSVKIHDRERRRWSWCRRRVIDKISTFLDTYKLNTRIVSPAPACSFLPGWIITIHDPCYRRAFLYPKTLTPPNLHPPFRCLYSTHPPQYSHFHRVFKCIAPPP